MLGALATYAEPHCYDLCAEDAERLTGPRGWEVMRLAPQVTGEFQVVLDRPPPIDYPVPITVEVAREVPVARYDELAGEVAARLQAELNFTAAVSPVPPSGVTIERKTRRVVRRYRGEVD